MNLFHWLQMEGKVGQNMHPMMPFMWVQQLLKSLTRRLLADNVLEAPKEERVEEGPLYFKD